MSTSSSPLRPVPVRVRPLAAAAVLCLVGALAACGGASPDPGASPSAAVSSAAAGGASTSSAALTIDITIADGTVTPNAERIDVARGTTVTLHVTSDADDEIHAHTAGDGYELEVRAGQPATGSFVASDVGSFEVESHHLDKVIAILNVR